MTMLAERATSPTPQLQIMRKDLWLTEDWDHRLKTWDPKTDLGRFVRDEVMSELPAELQIELFERFTGPLSAVITSQLRASHWDSQQHRWLDLGVVSLKKVTTAGVGFLVDAWQNITELENLKYHGVGTGTTAEANTDTALVTESTTILNPDSTRATGSLTEGASANIFRTVGTPAFDGSGAITEHGIFSQAATGGGVLWDRSVFSAINVVSGDSIQFTYDLTASAEA